MRSPSQDTEAKVPCCCGKAETPKDSPTDPEDHEQQKSAGTKDGFERSNNDPRSSQVSPIRRFNSSDSVTTCETGSSGSIRKFNSCEQLQSPDRFAGGYNRARVTEINDEEDEVVDEINEPVFVDIPTLVAVLIKPDDSLHESSARIEEICADEVQEDSIDADFGIEAGNEEYDESTTKLDDDNRSNSTNSCNVPDDQEINEVSSAERGKSRGEFSKQDSLDLSSSNLNISRKFGSIDGINKSREPVLDLQRSQTNLERRPALAERAKKLNNIREIDDRKASGKSAAWRTIGNAGSKDLQRKSSNESDKSAKDSNSGKARRPSLESLKRKTSKDSSSSSSKDEQILISSLTRDKFLRRKNSLEYEAAGARQHTAIQRVKRAEIVAAVTERLYSSRKHTEESNMASNSASGTRSPPEGNADVKLTSSSTSGLSARSRLQEISRKMLLRRRRINVDTQTEAASTLRLRDVASLTEEPRVLVQDAAVLTDDHEDCAINRDALVAETDVADHRPSVLRVKDVATLTDRRPRADIFRCKDAETLTNDLEFDEYEMQSRNDLGVLFDDATRNCIESGPSSIGLPEQFCHLKGDRRVLCMDNSTNTFLTSSVRNSAVQTTHPEVDRWKASSENRGCARCCNMTHETGQSVSASNSSERNVISISLPDMISITIESTNGLESRIAMMDGADVAEAKSKLVFNDKESQTDEHIDSEAERSSLMNLRSTATQADGRVFRIENIFEDPKSKNHREMTSDPRRRIATKKSVTFRNSLGTSSIIGARETEAEWNGGHVDDAYHRKRAILKGGLTRAFIAKKRSCSLSPRRPAHRLVRHDLWRNWTLPRPGKSPGLVDSETRTSSGEANPNSALVDNLSPRISGDISADEVRKEPTNELSSALRASRSNSRRTKTSAKSLLAHEHNFSDDSLDDDEGEVADHRSADAEMANSRDRESLCPPDVVAHTKREGSKSANLTKVESSIDDDYDDTEVEFPKIKSIEISNNDPLRDYEALILETSSYIVDSVSSEEETSAITTPSVSKKKVSFSNNNPERISDIPTMIPTSRQDSETALKSIIKKIMKPAATESLDIVQQRKNIEIDQSLQRRKIESASNEEISFAGRENQDSVDPGKPFDDKMVEFPNEDRSESCGKTDETSCSHSLPMRKNILEEYLNEATTFMRNMNSINEYMSATSVLESHGKRRRKRGSRRGNNPRADKDSTECRGRRASPRDDEVDPCHSHENGIAAESYEKCLRSIERLEACIDKVNRHNQVLRDRYGIDVESTGAKSSLAYPSIDSRMPVAIDDGAIDTGSEDRDDEPRICPSSVRDDDARRFAPNETETLCRIGERDGGVTAEDDLERRIFDQLMRAADSSCGSYRSPTESQRERHLWKSELRSRSPTTYCKFRATCRRYGRGILNFDQVPAAADYLGDIREIEDSHPSLRQARQTGTSAIDSDRFRDEVLRKNDDSVETKVPREPAIFKARVEHVDLTDPARLIETPFAEEETARGDTQGSKDGLRVESMNLRAGGPLSVELKYPGSPRAKFLELLKERRRIVENSRGTNAF